MYMFRLKAPKKSHRHVGFSDVPPSVIQSRLEAAGVRIAFREDGEPRGLLADGTHDTMMRWLWVHGNRIRWGVTTTPRRDHPGDEGQRVFVMGKAAALPDAVQIIQAVVAEAPPPANPPAPANPLLLLD